MESESKLVPVLREGIEVVKMIFFKEMQGYLSKKNYSLDSSQLNRLAGAVINEFFGIVNPDKSFQDFAAAHSSKVNEILSELAENLEKMRIPLTDALRTMVLCDNLEGVDNSSLLAKAEDHGILLKDRDLPMPNKFIELTRRLGAAYGIINPPRESLAK